MEAQYWYHWPWAYRRNVVVLPGTRFHHPHSGNRVDRHRASQSERSHCSQRTDTRRPRSNVFLTRPIQVDAPLKCCCPSTQSLFHFRSNGFVSPVRKQKSPKNGQNLPAHKFIIIILTISSTVTQVLIRNTVFTRRTHVFILTAQAWNRQLGSLIQVFAYFC